MENQGSAQLHGKWGDGGVWPTACIWGRAGLGRRVGMGESGAMPRRLAGKSSGVRSWGWGWCGGCALWFSLTRRSKRRGTTTLQAVMFENYQYWARRHITTTSGPWPWQKALILLISRIKPFSDRSGPPVGSTWQWWSASFTQNPPGSIF
jgi:hypothetical protein